MCYDVKGTFCGDASREVENYVMKIYVLKIKETT
jgi:hypothetical protein